MTQSIDIQVSCSGGLPRFDCQIWYHGQCKYTDGESFPFELSKIDLMQTSIQGELQHKIIKHCFACTNKRRYTLQLAASEVCERFLQCVAQCLAAHGKLSEIGLHQVAQCQKRAHTENSNEEGEESHNTIAWYVIL